MKIVIFNRLPFEKIKYDNVINHTIHDVTYIGSKEDIITVPKDLRCLKVDIPNLSVFNEVLEVTRNLNIKGKIDHFIAISEYDLLMAAQIRAELGITGPSVADVNCVRDKVIMKEIISKHGIECPRFLRLSDKTYTFNLKFPVILKPVDGAASVGVETFKNESELKIRLKTIDTSEISGYEVEEFIDGPVLHFDGWTKDGIIQDFVPSSYVNSCLDFLDGLPFGSCQYEDFDKKYKSWAQKVLDALNIKKGSFHLEGILRKGTLYFLEIGHRVGGARVAETFEMKTGVNLYHAHIASCLSIDYKFLRKFQPESFGWFVYPGHSLPLKWNIEGIESIKESSHLVLSKFGLRDRAKTSKVSYLPEQNPFSGICSTESGNESEIFLKFLFNKIRVVDC